MRAEEQIVEGEIEERERFDAQAASSAGSVAAAGWKLTTVSRKSPIVTF